eukprot:NODE_1399_length_1431_cov_12.955137_g1164_i0.p1 GENE.NODE_1399_length_1431_cov_12.955137_g1164_i0~~NODE_1399_length_1431_cov_12.955137_g1164_i0.p1  ORF type:complete len:405 (-),score=81.00 NODE_1399_length_1431_cov_12.955137_g1164_i0:75-1289(-)
MSFLLDEDTLRLLTLKRSTLHHWINDPNFAELAKGCWVRVLSGDAKDQNPVYTFARIVDVIDRPQKVYSFGGKPASKYLVLSFSMSKWSLNKVSNDDATHAERQDWVTMASAYQIPPPSQSELDFKLSRLTAHILKTHGLNQLQDLDAALRAGAGRDADGGGGDNVASDGDSDDSEERRKRRKKKARQGGRGSKVGLPVNDSAASPFPGAPANTFLYHYQPQSQPAPEPGRFGLGPLTPYQQPSASSVHPSQYPGLPLPPSNPGLGSSGSFPAITAPPALNGRASNNGYFPQNMSLNATAPASTFQQGSSPGLPMMAHQPRASSAPGWASADPASRQRHLQGLQRRLDQVQTLMRKEQAEKQAEQLSQHYDSLLLRRENLLDNATLLSSKGYGSLLPPPEHVHS